MNMINFSIIGAGSSYTPELIEEMAIRKDTLPVNRITLYDVDKERLDIMTSFCQRFAKKLGLETRIESTMELNKALEGADFVDVQIRVGGNRQRVLDEKIPLSFGLVGQETTGAGGMMKAFRTIPVVLEIARRMEEVSPSGWIINYTNPTGMITEAVTRYAKANIAGFCSGGILPRIWAKNSIGTGHNRVQYDYVGLNHLSFIDHLMIDGRPFTTEEFAKLAAMNSEIDPNLTELLGVLTSPYLQYYYHTKKKISSITSKGITRGEEVLALEHEIFKSYSDTSISDKPATLSKRGGGGYSEVAMNFVNAIHNNVDTEMVVNVPNRGAIGFLPENAVVEVGCLVNKTGIKPLRVATVPPSCWGLIAAVKNYEQLAVEAAVEGSIRKAKLALLAHPLVREYEIVEKLLPALLEANAPFLPQFNLAERNGK